MAVADKGRRALYYNRNVPHTQQRVGLMHGLYHHLSDIKDTVGMRECNLALATLSAEHAAPGSTVRVEVTVEYRRHTVAARVAPLPFFDPQRKRA